MATKKSRVARSTKQAKENVVPPKVSDDKYNEVTKPSKKSAYPSKIELLYDGYFYDVTSWIKKHPGGDVIKLYTESGEDSSVAIKQFHLRTFDRVSSIMRMLPKRPAVIGKGNNIIMFVHLRILKNYSDIRYF